MSGAASCAAVAFGVLAVCAYVQTYATSRAATVPPIAAGDLDEDAHGDAVGD